MAKTPGSRASPSLVHGAQRRSRVSSAAARATKLTAVSTAIRPGKTLVKPAGSRKSSSSIPRLVPNTYSARFSKPSNPASAAVARENATGDPPAGPVRSHSARPASRKATAVLGTIATCPGSTCMRARTPKSHPARTKTPMAIAAAAQSREILLSGSAGMGVAWLPVIGRTLPDPHRGNRGANPSIWTVASFLLSLRRRSLSGDWRAPPVPVRLLLIRLRGGEAERFVPRGRHERDAQREARRVEAARDARGRQAAEISRGAERIRGKRVPRLQVRLDRARGRGEARAGDHVDHREELRHRADRERAAPERVDVVGRGNRRAGQEPGLRERVHEIEMAPARDEGLEGCRRLRRKDREENRVEGEFGQCDGKEPVALRLERFQGGRGERHGFPLIPVPGLVRKNTDPEPLGRGRSRPVASHSRRIGRVLAGDRVEHGFEVLGRARERLRIGVLPDKTWDG